MANYHAAKTGLARGCDIRWLIDLNTLLQPLLHNQVQMGREKSNTAGDLAQSSSGLTWRLPGNRHRTILQSKQAVNHPYLNLEYKSMEELVESLWEAWEARLNQIDCTHYK
jgi:hypothetical protein